MILYRKCYTRYCGVQRTICEVRYTYLGTAYYLMHEGSRPMNVTWRLDAPSKGFLIYVGYAVRFSFWGQANTFL